MSKNIKAALRIARAPGGATMFGNTLSNVSNLFGPTSGSVFDPGVFRPDAHQSAPTVSGAPAPVIAGARPAPVVAGTAPTGIPYHAPPPSFFVPPATPTPPAGPTQGTYDGGAPEDARDMTAGRDTTSYYLPGTEPGAGADRNPDYSGPTWRGGNMDAQGRPIPGYAGAPDWLKTAGSLALSGATGGLGGIATNLAGRALMSSPDVGAAASRVGDFFFNGNQGNNAANAAEGWFADQGDGSWLSSSGTTAEGKAQAESDWANAGPGTWMDEYGNMGGSGAEPETAAPDSAPSDGGSSEPAVTESANGGRIMRADGGQAVTSAGTSRHQVPALFRSSFLKKGTTNLDYGGGKYDKGTEFLKTRGVESHVFDPFNRSEDHNAAVIDRFKKKPADTATLANVLNVIREPHVRRAVIEHASKHVKPDGTLHFGIYEGDGSGTGKATRDGWQNNAKAETYLDEVRSVHPAAYRAGATIIAPKRGARASGGKVAHGPQGIAGTHIKPKIHGTPVFTGKTYGK